MHPLFPEIHPDKTHRLKVNETHELYIEECGDARGIPVLFVHGGPGAGCEEYHRRFFDPNVYRIILFDQRGAGCSTPHASLEDNTTRDLVEDMEKIRELLGVDRWVLFGGSWGSTLSLVYAETHPTRVLGMVLRGIFLCRPEEIQWFYQDGANRIFPDYWKDFIQPIPENERGDLVAAHYKRLTADDEVARMASAKAWSLWEARTATLSLKRKVVDHFSAPRTALALSRIEAHYFINDSFLSANQILRDIKSIADIPGYIVHGRYDMVCPLQNAFDLAAGWPAAQLEIIPNSGHSASEPAVVDALVQATIGMVSRIND